MIRSTENGMALVGLIWGSVFIAIVAGSFVHGTRTDTRIMGNVLDAARAEALADGGINLGLAELLQARRDRNRVFDGKVRTHRIGGEKVLVSIQDESGKVDLNTASAALLRALYLSLGMASDAADALADATMDWRDRDSISRPLGAESADYRRAGRAYPSANAPFTSVAEFRYVLGVEPALFDRISPALTVHSGRRGIDPAVAPRAVLIALTGGAEAADDFIAERDRAVRASVSAFRALGLPRGFVSSSSRTTYTIRATARTKDGAVFVRLAVVRFGGDQRRPYRILQWSHTAEGAVAQGL